MRKYTSSFAPGLRAVLAFVLVVAATAAAPLAAQVDTGTADFSRYVAIGDSLTQGFSNGGVFAGVQANSYPALIAAQAGVTDFQQPLVSAPGIPGLLRLDSAVPPVITPRAGNGNPTNLMLPRPYDNLGVSGFDTLDVLVTTSGNPVIDLTLRGLGTALQQAVALQPTFVSVWIGNNDALGAATSGVVIDNVTLTTLSRFDNDYRQVVGALAATGADLLLVTIPDVAGIPFVTTVPPVLVNPATRQPVLVNGQPVPLLGPDGPLNPVADRVLLPASALLAQGIGIPAAVGGTGQPLPDSAVLSAAEVATISNRITGFNDIIRSVATDTGAALFDANAFFADVVNDGYPVGGVTLRPDFLTGGIFSYDGVHPTPLGYAVIADEMVQTINSQFGANLPRVNLAPFLFGPDGSAGAILEVPAGVVVFSDAAEQKLRDSLRVPSKQRLDRIKARRRGDDGGGGDGELQVMTPPQGVHAPLPRFERP